VNTKQLRQSVKDKWLTYYQENRHWLTRLAVWVNDKGQRRPSSSFILATLSVLEPQLPQLFPLIVELSNDPDRVVAALGLNFNPDSELNTLAKAEEATIDGPDVKMLPSGTAQVANISNRSVSKADEACEGISNRERSPLSP
jgi:hypothetical protein